MEAGGFRRDIPGKARVGCDLYFPFEGAKSLAEVEG